MSDAWVDYDYTPTVHPPLKCPRCDEDLRLRHYCGMKQTYAQAWPEKGRLIIGTEYDDYNVATVGIADQPGAFILTRYVSQWGKYTP
jgi:hypothetical protein